MYSSLMSLLSIEMTSCRPVLLASPLLPALPPVLVVRDGRVQVGQVSLGAGRLYISIVSDILPGRRCTSSAERFYRGCRSYKSVKFSNDPLMQ